MYVLDTDHISVLQHGEEPAKGALCARMDALDESAFFLTIVSFHEQALGWNAYIQRHQSVDRVVHAYRMYEGMLDEYGSAQLLSFDDRAAMEFIRLTELRIRLGATDLRIAAIVMTNEMTLLSRNLKDFQRVPNLRVEDWTKPQ